MSSPNAGSGFAVWLIREVVALLFVAGWLVLFAGELLSARYALPFWVHCVGVGTLGYALGLNAADLVYRPPTPVADALTRRRDAPGGDEP